MAKAVAPAHADKLLLYENWWPPLQEWNEKGATVPYTSLNGHMFSYLSKEGRPALRLPAGAREEFLTKYKATLCEAYGIVQPEYVEVPDALLKKTSELKRFVEISHQYVGALKPKPTSKPKPKKG